MAEIPLHDLTRGQADFPLFIGQIDRMDEQIQTQEPDRHTFYELVWIVSGDGTHNLDLTVYPIAPRTLFFVAPGQVHFWVVPRRSVGYVMVFAPEWLLGQGGGPGASREPGERALYVELAPALYLTVAEAGRIQSLIEQMFEEYTRQATGWQQVVQALLRILLVQIQRRSDSTGAPLADGANTLLLRRFKARLEERFRVDHTVQPYAQGLGVTPGHLTDVVRAVTGQPAGHLIRQRILLEAQRLLIHTNETAEAISAQLEFGDAAYFNRFFRRETGMTPNRFRQEFRKKYKFALV